MRPDIEKRIHLLLNDLREDEQEIYEQATEDFRRNRTYHITPEPLRSALQHDYGSMQVDRYIRKKKSSRSYALEDDADYR